MASGAPAPIEGVEWESVTSVAALEGGLGSSGVIAVELPVGVVVLKYVPAAPSHPAGLCWCV